ncbi:MAG: 1,4-alpha-glucan branching protein GlgB [Eubacterium sp.]
MNLHDFYTGEAFDAYDYFGNHQIEKEGTKGVEFRVYAPEAEKVMLIGAFNQWEGTPMEPVDAGGIYSIFVPGELSGMLYKYQISQKDGRTLDRSDPYGFSTELRPQSASVVTTLEDYVFKDDEWLAKRNKNFNKPMSIYEVHPGSWRRKQEDGPNGWYTYTMLCESLIGYVKEKGFTHIEFMPLSEYPADESWGYQVTGFFSATSRYGKPEELMHLIDRCHQVGIGVIMDFVPVHFAINDFALSQFSGTPLYEYPDPDTGHSEWGSYNFNYYRGEVRSFLKSAADFWMRVYHVDGLRLDAMSNALYWQGNKERGINEGAVTFIKGLNDGIGKRHPNVMRIAEDSTSYPKVTAPVDYDGLGFDYKWDMGWMNDTLAFFEINPADRKIHLGKLTFSMDYFYRELYLLPFSHDEVVHGKQSIINKMPGTESEKIAQTRLLYFYMFTHPGKKLNFMGNEWGQRREWSESRSLDWKLLEEPEHLKLSDFYTAINQFYTAHTALYAEDYNADFFRWLPVQDKEDTAVLAYERRSEDETLLIILNFSEKPIPHLFVKYDHPVKMEKCFSTDTDIDSPSEIFETKILKPSKKMTDKQLETVDEGFNKIDIPIQAFEGIILNVIK